MEHTVEDKVVDNMVDNKEDHMVDMVIHKGGKVDHKEGKVNNMEGSTLEVHMEDKKVVWYMQDSTDTVPTRCFRQISVRDVSNLNKHLAHKLVV